jgi:hypothetical protein
VAVPVGIEDDGVAITDETCKQNPAVSAATGGATSRNFLPLEPQLLDVELEEGRNE